MGSFAEVRGSRIRTRHMFPKNFISLRYNTHREKELRIAFNKILSLETTLPLDSDLIVVMKQATDGRKLVQAVYQGGYIKECDYTKDPQQVLDFVADFILPDILSFDKQFGDVFDSYGSNNVSFNHTVSFQYFRGLDFLKDFADLADFKSFVTECRSFYRLAKKDARQEAHILKHDSKLQNNAVNTDYSSGENFNVVPTSIDPDTGIYKHKRSKRSTEPIKKSRSKRSAFDFNSVLIFPGTKWCGKGDLAQCYDDLGPDQELDSCCRDHDCCPYMIPPFTSRFNMFNYRFHSVIHCDCDNRFRGCLRQSLSSTANMIGKIYFNILGSKCFSFQEQEICAERAWWGYCRKYETQVTAILQSQGSFHDDDDVSNHIDNNT